MFDTVQIENAIADKAVIVTPPRYLRHLRICIGEILNKYYDIKNTQTDYFIIEAYADRTLAVVLMNTNKGADKIQRALERDYGILVEERFSYKPQYGRFGTMQVFHCKIIEEVDCNGN